ncbi:MAG: MBOAT family protein [Lachnospiraceae bacterium]|nr:MBOAT family protein [Lachnospiraceae bacterium]
MVFTSLLFLYGFMPLSLLVYGLVSGQKAKNTVLLIFSLIFYAWGEPVYVLLLILMSFFSWIFALGIQRSEKQSLKKLYCALSCIISLLLIGFFKYSSMICSLFGEPPAFIKNIALPVGISFYTFQLLTYDIDVYRGDAKAENSFFHVLLYASLFHQCIAGPIVRYSSIADELFVQRSGEKEVPEGIRRFCFALAKKTLLANTMGSLADTFLLSDTALAQTSEYAANLSRLSNLSAPGAWLGVLAYSLQIYLDFSAYSDMAIGLGQMLGLHYPENFNYPYISRSVTEFWRRWHISLSVFFRDYVYIPLGGNRKGILRTILNLLIVWTLTGLWHGADWNFVLWGLYYFLLLVIEKSGFGKLLKKLPILSHLYLLLAVMLGWILFRFQDLSFVWAVVKACFSFSKAPDLLLITKFKNNLFILIISILACTPVVPGISRCLDSLCAHSAGGKKFISFLRYGLVPSVLLLLSTAALVGASYNPFIYFKF